MAAPIRRPSPALLLTFLAALLVANFAGLTATRIAAHSSFPSFANRVESDLAPAPRWGDANSYDESASDALVATRGILKTPSVSHTKLQNIVNDLYKGTTSADRVGTGTTMDAIRHELLTGEPVQEVFHLQKGEQYSNALGSVLKQDLSYYDRLVAQSLYDDLQRALRGEL